MKVRARTLGVAATLLAVQLAPALAQEESASADTIPVEPLREPAPDEPAFPPLEPGFGALVTAMAGYDSNANSATDTDRFFFFNLAREDQASDSAFFGASAVAEYVAAFSGRSGWRNAIGGEARQLPEAEFASSFYVNGISQLRWIAQKYQGDAGLIFTTASIDQGASNEALGAAAQIERLTGPVVLGLGAEYAVWRYPDASIQDVDALILRLKLGPAPDAAGDNEFNLGLHGGVEEAREDGSPYGRNMFGASAEYSHRMGVNLLTQFGFSVLHSNYDGSVTANGEAREDYHAAADWGYTWKPAPESMWVSSVSLRIIRNQSNDPLFDYTRAIIMLDVGRAWRPQKS